MRLANINEMIKLAEHLEDTPETVIAKHLLNQGLCNAFFEGDINNPKGLIVQSQFQPEEPTAFCEDEKVFIDLMQNVKGWTCVNIDSSCPEKLGKAVEKNFGRNVWYYGDTYYVLKAEPIGFEHPDVRYLSCNDLPLLEGAPESIQGCGFKSRLHMLTDGVVAGAVINDELKAIAHTSAITTKYADVGVHTLELWRNKGYSSAAAAIVCRRLLDKGIIPVWSTGDDNHASHKIAQKLGFMQVSRRVYIILA